MKRSTQQFLAMLGKRKLCPSRLSKIIISTRIWSYALSLYFDHIYIFNIFINTIIIQIKLLSHVST